MTLSLGDAVMASMCAFELDAAAVGAGEAGSSRGMPCCTPVAASHAVAPGAENTNGMSVTDGAEAPGDSDHGSHNEVPCPLGPAAGGCTAAASLPAHTFDDLAASPESVTAVVFDHTQHSLSFASAPFHPPKA